MEKQDFLKQVFMILKDNGVTGKQAFEVAKEMTQDYRNIQCEDELYDTVLLLMRQYEKESN